MSTGHTPRRVRRVTVPLVEALLVALLAACTVPTPPADIPDRPTAVAAAGCELPAAGRDFQRVAPAAVDLDPEVVRRVVDYVAVTGARSYRIYRRGCLVGDGGLDPGSADDPQTSFSMTKSVVSLVVGRAITAGRLRLDDPVGPHLRRAGVEVDEAKAALTVRHFLTQTTGVRMSYVQDLVEAVSGDSVAAFLARPFEAVPGTTFIYAQTAVTALTVVVEGAVGRDFQDYARDELFRPVGIEDREWRWARDPGGNTQGFAALEMSPRGFARLGMLAGRAGVWDGRRLIRRDYLDEAQRGATGSNPCYGFLIRSNRSPRCANDGVPTAQIFDRRWLPPAPPDAFGFSGAFDQEATVIPSLDMVLVRMGPPSFLTRDPLGPTSDLFNAAWSHRSARLLMRGVRDVPQPLGPDWAPDPDARRVDLARILPIPLPEPHP